MNMSITPQLKKKMDAEKKISVEILITVTINTCR